MNAPLPAWTDTFAHVVMPWVPIIRELPWVGIMVELLVALFAVAVAHRVGTAVLQRIAAPFPYSRRLVHYGDRASAAALFLLAAQVILRNAPDPLPGVDAARHLTALGLIASLTWLGARCVRAVSHTIIELHPDTEADNLQARRVQTQTKVLARSASVLIILLGTGSAMMTLPLLRQIGTSLLASAGVAGLVVGFAAKPVLGNLLAGLQLALTQAIRLQDVVIVENEWGWVEEITGTYVVLRLWDLRRMVVPLQWFIEHPFQNWTRTNADLLGTVHIWADYRLPLDPIRIEARRICENAPEWDGRLCVVQMIEAGERAMQFRVLVSAADSPRLWDLRCRMREQLVDYMQRHYPQYLPQLRMERLDRQGEPQYRRDGLDGRGEGHESEALSARRNDPALHRHEEN